MLKLYWHRLINPTRRLGVTLRYGGASAIRDLALQRYREMRPLPAAGGDSSPAAVIEPSALADLAMQLPQFVRAPSSSPDISVIVRTHNRPALLRQALISLANQTIANFEVIVVNDGERDVRGALDELESYLDLRLADHATGSGRMVALNSGLAAARGRWITYLDDDDIVYPTHLERLVEALKNGRASVSYSDAIRALCWSDSEQDEVVERVACESVDFDLDRLLVDNWIASVAFMHASECLQVVGRFDESLQHFEDWDFLIRLGRACAVTHIPAFTYEYRYRFGPMPEGSRSALVKRQQILDCTAQMYERYPTASRELSARRSLTLAALSQDIEEIRHIEEGVADPVYKDLLITARIGRFPVPPAVTRRFNPQT